MATPGRARFGVFGNPERMEKFRRRAAAPGMAVNRHAVYPPPRTVPRRTGDRGRNVLRWGFRNGSWALDRNIGGMRVNTDGIRTHRSEDVAGRRAAGQVAARILDDVVPLVEPGVTTEAVDSAIEKMVKEAGAESATIDYKEYRHASCISVNHVVCHGVPGAKKLRDGDILNIDVTVILDGWYGDTSRMYVVGTPSRKAERLLQVTHDALMRGIEAVKPGNRLGDVGHAIQSYVESQRMSVVRDYCGHGLGRVFHAPPSVLHYGRPGEGVMLEEGMFFTIEPMVNLGRAETKVLADGWTAVTRDKTLSAQFEHSIGVTAVGADVFTLSPAGRFHPTRG